jgi:hypothetical protein
MDLFRHGGLPQAGNLASPIDKMTAGRYRRHFVNPELLSDFVYPHIFDVVDPDCVLWRFS